jgi:CheY-like chemotaxis protein
VPDNVPLAEDQSVLLFQSVRELLMNIKKHAGTQTAHVTIERRDSEVRITVCDEGAGMNLSAAMATHSESSVMSSKFGLFSIRERMRAIGGRFELESAPGRGTTAVLVVPLVLKEKDAPNGDEPETADSAMESIVGAGMPPCDSQADHHGPHQIRVLLADDHLMVREGLRTLLKEQEDIAIVGEAWDGEEAVAFADRLRPDVVIMDVNMPRLDGIEATRRIKAAFRSIAVVGISVNASAEVEAAMRMSGADAFLSKEAAGQEICQTIKALGKAGVE